MGGIFLEIIKREQAVEFDAFVKSHYKASFMQGSPWAGVKKTGSGAA